MHGIATNVMFLEQSDCLGPEPMIRCYSTMETRTHPIRALPEVEGNTNHQKRKNLLIFHGNSWLILVGPLCKNAATHCSLVEYNVFPLSLAVPRNSWEWSPLG